MAARPRWPAAAGGGASGGGAAAEERGRGSGGVVRGGGCGARGVLRGPLNRRPRRWSGEQALGGVNGGAVLGSPASYVHRRRRARRGGMGRFGRRRPRAGDAVRGSPELWASTASGAGGAAQSAPRRGVGAHGERSGAGQRRGGAERDRAACEGGQAGPKAACPGGGRGRVEKGGGRRRGRGPGAHGREGRKEREEGRGKEKKEKEEKKEKRKKMGKRKRKRKGGKRNKEREGASASALIAAAVGHACVGRVRRAGRGPTGVGQRNIWVSGLWGIGRSGGTGRIPEDWGLGF